MTRPLARLNMKLSRHATVLRTALGIILQTGILAVGGLAFWAVVGHNAGGDILGRVATASSIASLASAAAAAGALHLVIARKEHLRPLVSALAVVCPLLAFIIGVSSSPQVRVVVGLWSAASALGLVTDAAAVAAQRPRRVAARAAVQVVGGLSAAIFLHTFDAFVISQTACTALSSLVQYSRWVARPSFKLLRRLSVDVWSNHIAGVTGVAPVYVVAPLATLMSTSVIAGREYLAMSLVGPLTSISVALSAGVHTGGPRSASDTRHLYSRSIVTVFTLASLASVATLLLHFAGPSFAAVADVTAAMTFATVLDASSNIFCGVWRLERRLIVVPTLYIAELVAFIVAVVLTIKPLGLTSVVCGWYAQGVAGMAVVWFVERRFIPTKGVSETNATVGSA